MQELQADAKTTPNVVEATNKQGLYEKLEDIQKRCTSQISTCSAVELIQFTLKMTVPTS